MDRPCTRIGLHDAMFVGHAVSETIVKPKTEQEWPRRVYKFVITESFKGPQRVGDEVTIVTGLGGGDCGIGFDIGEGYLVDAFRYGTALRTSICSHTTSERRATVLIRQLRALASGGRIPDLDGRVAISPSQAYAITGNSKSLPQIPVQATETATGIVHRTHTDDEGIYTFEVLPPGDYTLSAVLPTRLTTHPDGPENPPKITLPDAGGTGAACHLEVNVFPTGRIPGRVVDADGKGVPGSVYAYPSPSEAKLERHEWAATAGVASDGNFELHGLREGTYHVMFEHDPNPTNNLVNRQPLQIAYYPSVSSAAGASTVQVPDGAASTPIRLVFKP